MFETGSKVYTDEDIYTQNDILIFEAFKSYEVYATEEDGISIPCLVAEDGLLHDINNVGHLFLHQH
jgi:hypothetical protein